MSTEKIRGLAVLGAGNIGMSIATQVRKYMPTGLSLTRTSKNHFSREQRSKFTCFDNNTEAVSMAEVVVIAVRPPQLDTVLKEIKDVLRQEQLIISVVSGVKIERIEELVGRVPIARAMPNTAMSIKESMTCMTFNDAGRDHKHRVFLESMFGATAMPRLLIPEEKFPEATVLCGSGIALAQKFIRAFMQAGIQHGFNEKDALALATQVIKGAAMLIQENGQHPEVEIDRVTTPDGCTIYALAELEHAGFSSALLKSIDVGVEKARQLYS